MVDILDVLLNVVVFLLTGSVVMVAEALEGLADLVSSGLLLIGLRRAKRIPDSTHPFGYGRELYFWTLIAALFMFVFTSGLSIYFGWQRLSHPEPIENLQLAYVVLTFAILTNGYAFSLSFRRLLGERNPAHVWRIFIRTTLVETKTTFVLDLMGTTAAVLGLFSLALFGFTGDLRFDGLGAIIIGVVLAILAFSLLLTIKDLLIGIGASEEVQKQIKKAALEVKGVEGVLDLRTMLVGPEKLLVNIEVHLVDKLTTAEIEKLVDKIKENVGEAVPTVQHIQVELETPDEELARK